MSMSGFPIRVLNIEYTIPWGSLIMGHSFFLPCVDVDVYRVLVCAQGAAQGFFLIGRTQVEGGKLGLRFWVLKAPPPSAAHISATGPVAHGPADVEAPPV